MGNLVKNILKYFKNDMTNQQMWSTKNNSRNDFFLYESLFENSTIGLYQTTPEGEILSVNPAIVKMLKYDSLEELLRKDLRNGSYVDDSKSKEFREIMALNGEVIDFEAEWLTKDGETITVLEAAYAVKNEEGKIIRYDGVAQDITARKKTENDLVKALKNATESDRLKSAFLTNMSHEIRTPMNGILGFSSLLKNTDNSHEEQIEYIRIIEKSGNRLLNIINNIVSISKIDSGQITLIYSKFDINQLMDDIPTAFEEEFQQKGVELEYFKGLPSKLSVIESDRGKVNDILIELLKNAFKFTESGSIEFGYVTKGKFLEFYIKDTGIGIQEDRQDIIFERFIQADIEDKNAYQGAGLGLAIAKAYVEKLGGEIWLNSKVGKGTQVFFTLEYHPID